MTFDPYHKWLGIPPAEQPPHHYRLLGIALFESDPDVIDGAADRQMAHLRTFQSSQHSALSQQILNELAAAKLCLLNPRKKAAYDALLRRSEEAVASAQQPLAQAEARPIAAERQAPDRAAANLTVANCPSASILSRFGLGKLDAEMAETVSQHLAICGDCRQKVADVSGDGFVDLLRAAVVAGEQPANPGHTFGDRDGAGGLETTIDRANSPRGMLGRKPASIARHQPDLADHPDYEIVKELGHGGMGVVYLARNRLMDRLEVLKVLKTSLLERPGALERFQQEIRSAAKLSHINIVASYAVLRTGDSLVFAMEYVPGEDLAQVIHRRGPLRVANAAYYAHQAALGLQHAHEKGMVHRDIKPNNLMLAVDGKKHVVKILDFGLAKATSEKDAETGLTKSGQILGTPDYLAPEQSRDAQHADIRADIYSLGCTLYFLLSGTRPFPEASLYDVLDAHQKRDAKPLDQVRPEVPPELADVVAKMMAKTPADRYQTPLEVAKALIPFFKPGQGPAPSVPCDDEQHPQYTMDTAASEQPAASDSPAAPAPSAQTALPLSPPRAVPIAVPLSKSAFDTSIDFETPLIDTEQEMGPPMRRWRLYLATCLAPLVLMLAIAIVVRTPRGTIEIELNDPNADVTLAVDGHRLDIAGLDAPLSLEVGEHRFKITGEGFETITDRFTVTKGPNAPLVITLRKKTGPAPPPTLTGTIEISLSDPSANAAVYIDGDLVNLADRYYELLSLDVGEHKLTVTGEGYETISDKFVIAKGENDPLTVMLKPLKADREPLAPTIEPRRTAGPPPPAVAPFDAKQARAHQEAWAEYLSVPVKQANSIGMKLVLIPPGEFMMGSTPEQIATQAKFLNDTAPPAHESPAHRITLANPFLIGATEVTIGQFRRFADATNYVTDAERLGGDSDQSNVDVTMRDKNWRTSGYPVTDDSPVAQITWTEAARFCAWLTTREGLKPCYAQGWTLAPPGDGYRLPTEAEWEYACRAGTDSLWSFGNDPKLLKEHAWFGQNSEGRAHSVGSQLPNAFGLFDMYGNLWEWCHDWWTADYYQVSPTLNPTGPEPGGGRTIRGGSYEYGGIDAAMFERSASRFGTPPSRRFNSGGFRVVRVLTKPVVSETVGSVTPQLPLAQPISEKLKKQVTISFPRNTLEKCLMRLGEETRIEIEILTADLRAEGITKNQSLGLDEKDQIAGDILRKIFKLANPDGKLVYVIKTNPGTSDEVLYVTTRAAALKSGDILPPEFQVPPHDSALAKQTATKGAAAGDPGSQQWVDDVRALPAEKQFEAAMWKLREVNAGSIGKVTHRVENGAVVELGLHSTGLKDLSPVRALSGLKRFTYRGDWKASKRYSDLSPLSGLQLSRLECQFSGISDLLPLKGMPLTHLDCSNSNVSDLSPLIGMKLSFLRCAGTKVVDLSPLRGMPLKSLDISGTLLEDLGPLKGGALTSLVCGHSNVRDLSPLVGMPLNVLDISGNPQADLTAIKSLPLQAIRCSVSSQEQITLLRSIKSLASINYKPAQTALSEAEQAIKARK